MKNLYFGPNEKIEIELPRDYIEELESRGIDIGKACRIFFDSFFSDERKCLDDLKKFLDKSINNDY